MAVTTTQALQYPYESIDISNILNGVKALGSAFTKVSPATVVYTDAILRPQTLGLPGTETPWRDVNNIMSHPAIQESMRKWKAELGIVDMSDMNPEDLGVYRLPEVTVSAPRIMEARAQRNTSRNSTRRGGSGTASGNPRGPKRSFGEKVRLYVKENPGKTALIGAGLGLFGYGTLNHAIPSLIDLVTLTNAGTAPVPIPMLPPNKGWLYNPTTNGETNPEGKVNPDDLVIVTDPATGEQKIMTKEQAEAFKSTATSTPSTSTVSSSNGGDESRWYNVEATDPNDISTGL